MKYIHILRKTIHQMINNSKAKLSNIKKSARQIRKDHLIKLADNYTKANNVTQQTAINELLEQEDIRQTFKILKNKLKPVQSPNLKTLWVSIDENGKYCKDFTKKQVYGDQESIHREILRRNAEHLSQASSTPFAKGWLKKRLKWDGTGDIADNIFTGQILNKYKIQRVYAAIPGMPTDKGSHQTRHGRTKSNSRRIHEFLEEKKRNYGNFTVWTSHWPLQSGFTQTCYTQRTPYHAHNSLQNRNGANPVEENGSNYA